MKELAPTDRELELLKILWQCERATVREIYDRLHAPDSQLAYTTVLSLLQTMERKGLVGHEPARKAYVYFPAVQRERTFRSLARSFLDKVSDGAVDEYLVRALESRPPTPGEVEQLEAMIAEHKRQAKQRQRRGPKT